MTPTVQGFLRGLALAGAIAIIDATITYISGNTIQSIYPTLAPFQPLLILALRTIEGVIDHARDNNAAPAV